MEFSCSIGIFLNSAHLICRSTDISKCFRGSLRLRDNESRLYFACSSISFHYIFISTSVRYLSQRAHDVEMASFRHRCDMITSHRHQDDVISTPCACWCAVLVCYLMLCGKNSNQAHIMKTNLVLFSPGRVAQ